MAQSDSATGFNCIDAPQMARLVRETVQLPGGVASLCGATLRKSIRHARA